MKMNKIAANVLAFTRSTAGKVATGATAMVASGAALASGGGPAEAITAEITSGKSSVNGILVVLAGVLGLFLLWKMIKRAN
ncbi:TPA: hypothetical protein ACKQCJ_000207 [Stenotrophomonas maltophilia]